MKAALGKPSAFPTQLTPIGGLSLPIPAVSFGSAAPNLKKAFNNSIAIDIYATPDQYFTTKFREIFQKTRLTHHSGKESNKLLGGPNMSYWLQQLNFAVWCATTGCEISREIFDKDHLTLGFPAQVYSFYQFHVYFTVRRILYQLIGIQSISTFSQANNKYDVASYKRICAEFGINPSSDFRLTKGANHGLGSVHIYVSYSGPEKPNMITQDQTNFQTKMVRRPKATLFIISIKIPMPKSRRTGFVPTAQKD